MRMLHFCYIMFSYTFINLSNCVLQYTKLLIIIASHIKSITTAMTTTTGMQKYAFRWAVKLN